MANAFLNNQEYANVMLLLLKNSLHMGKLVDGQFKDQVTDKNGLQIQVKRPPRFIVNDGATLAKQDIVTGSEIVKVDQYKNVHVGVGDLEYVQSYNELMQNATMKSAASELAHHVDGFLHEKFKDFFSWVGTPGTAIGSPAQFFPVHTRLMEQSVPNEDLNAVLTFQDGENIRAALTGGDIQGINRNALERTRIPLLSDINVYASNNTKSLTTGTRTNGAVNGAAQNVTYLSVKDNVLLQQNLAADGFGAAATIKKGEVFTIAGVNAINPRSRENLGRLQQFTVVEDATADGTGAVAALKISPAIITSGAFQTVSAAPADNAVITFLGTASTAYPLRAAFHKKAIALVSARLATPFTGEASFASDPETGIGIRYWRGSDISTGEHIHRWDMIYGASTMDNMLGARLNGS